MNTAVQIEKITWKFRTCWDIFHFPFDSLTNIDTHRVPVGLLVLSSVAGVAERLAALLEELAQERLLPGVAPDHEFKLFCS